RHRSGCYGQPQKPRALTCGARVFVCRWQGRMGVRLASTPLEFTEWYLLGVALPLGSFVGVIVERLPKDGSPLTGRSSCTHCGAALTLRDLVPLASWLAMRGRCRHCGAWLGCFYPCVELAALAVAMLSLVVDRGADAWIDAALGWWLLALAWIDWR